LLHLKWGRMNPNVPVNPKRPMNFLELKDLSENLTLIENDTFTAPLWLKTWNKSIFQIFKIEMNIMFLFLNSLRRR
jgi:hypothetical protein